VQAALLMRVGQLMIQNDALHCGLALSIMHATVNYYCKYTLGLVCEV